MKIADQFSFSESTMDQQHLVQFLNSNNLMYALQFQRYVHQVVAIAMHDSDDTSESDDDVNSFSFAHIDYMKLRDRSFKEHFRMHKHTFEAFYNEIAPLISKTNRPVKVPLDIQLLGFLANV